jgi:hypothetical membrane protein
VGAGKMKAWVPIVGLGAVVIYLTLTMAAVALYPGSASPAHIYLSELGNADLSPNGWLLFGLAMILGGLLEIPFFVALSKHFANTVRKGLLRTGSVAGVVNGVSVVMAGVFAEHVNKGVHVAWSVLIFISLVPLLTAYGVTFVKLSGLSKLVGVYGLAVCAVDVGSIGAVAAGGMESSAGSIMEWVVAFTYLSWVGLVSVDLLRRWRTG